MRSTKISKIANLTLCVNMYTEEYFDKRIKEGKRVGDILRELTLLAKENDFNMCTRSAIEKQYARAKDRLNNVGTETSSSTEGRIGD